MKEGLLIVLSAPSGAGKTSLVQALVAADDDLVVSVSHTTRAKRSSEVDGTNYHFVTEDTFTKMIAEGAFLENAQVFGNRYGTAKQSVQKQRQAGQDVILEIDWQGGVQILKNHPDAVGIFVLPPARTTLLERLKSRALDSAEVIANRSALAIEEMSHYHKYHYVVVNDDFDLAKSQIQTVIAAQRLTTEVQQKRLQPLIDSLLSAN